ncbi:MAG: RecX family transcriptional regulator [Ignavibacteriae bacterium]|nr:RecX family transcriptional regulator [Ignavibacteria bacterium]MBI3363993.1 RecX family transcriptional regulator [Ignavibacteriota bacterium]
MTITKIERQKRDSHRVNIFIDNKFAFGIQDQVLVKFGLRKGDILDDEQINTIASSEEYNLAKQKALRYISYRTRSEKELRTKLIEKEFPPDVIDKTIEQLRDLGLINDVAFARSFVHDQQLRRPAGKRLLAQKLRLKGISNSIIQQVLSEAAGTDEERSAALEAAKKHLKRRRLPKDKLGRIKEQQRIAQFLARRGFEWSTISPVLRALFTSDTIEHQEA